MSATTESARSSRGPQAAPATYVYGVLAADTPLPDIAGIGGRPLAEVTSRGLMAMTSDLTDRELRLGREDMTTHARVLEEALEHGTVLPMRFGVVMAGEEAIRASLLEAHHDELEEQLASLHDKVELRVRAVYDEVALMREIVDQNPEIAALRQALKGASEDATYYDRIRLGELVARAVEDKRDVDATAMLGELSPYAIATQNGEPTHERVVFSASFLVDRSKVPEFDRALDAQGEAQAGRVRFKYVGPLPPHSFVELAATD
jgi:hypothetical protein